MNTDFLYRLRSLSKKRDMTPWLKGLGLSAGSTTLVVKEGTVTADLLTALARTERANVLWLQDGRGPMCIVNRVLNDAEAIALLERLLVDDFGAFFATVDGAQFALVLHRPAEYQYKTKTIEYREVEVISGGVGRATVRWLCQRLHLLQVLPLSTADFDRLAMGEMPNLELFGYQDPRRELPGLWENLKPTINDKKWGWLYDNQPSSGVAEPAEQYSTDDNTLLLRVVRVVEESLSDMGVELLPEAKIELIKLLHEEACRGGGPPDPSWIKKLVNFSLAV